VLPPERLAECFDLESCLTGVDEIFSRATGPGP
jgi:hypothetical protein